MNSNDRSSKEKPKKKKKIYLNRFKYAQAILIRLWTFIWHKTLMLMPLTTRSNRRFEKEEKNFLKSIYFGLSSFWFQSMSHFFFFFFFFSPVPSTSNDQYYLLKSTKLWKYFNTHNSSLTLLFWWISSMVALSVLDFVLPIYFKHFLLFKMYSIFIPYKIGIVLPSKFSRWQSRP